MENKELQTPVEGTQAEKTAQKIQEPETPAEKTPPNEPEIDYKEKFAESSREAQILAYKLKEQEERINQLTNRTLPTDDDLKREYPEWDNYSSELQTVLAKQSAQSKELNSTKKMLLELTEEKKWNEDFNRIITNSEFKDKMAGREEDFKKFAYKPTHKDVSLDVLAKAFLYEPFTQTPANIKGSALEKGSAGPKNFSRSSMTAEESKDLRTKDYDKWALLIKQGKIKPEDLL